MSIAPFDAGFFARADLLVEDDLEEGPAVCFLGLPLPLFFCGSDSTIDPVSTGFSATAAS